MHSDCQNGTDCTTLRVRSLWNRNLRTYFHSLPKLTLLEKVSYAYAMPLPVITTT